MGSFEGPEQGRVAELERLLRQLEQERQRIEGVAERVSQQMGEANALFDALADPVVVYGLDGTPVRANAAAIETFGFDPTTVDREAMVRRLSLRHPDGRPIALEDLPSTRALRGAMVRGERHVFTNTQGQDITILCFLSPLVIGGQVSGAVGIWHDITEHERAEQALRESEAKYRSLFENMLAGFAYHKILLDEEGRPVDYIFLEANAAFERLTGLKRQEIIGKRVTEVLPGIERSEFDWIGTYGRVALTGEPVAFDHYAEPLDRWYSVSAYSAERGYFGVVFSDITDRKRAEEAIQDALQRSQRRDAEVSALLTSSRAILDSHDLKDAAQPIFDSCRRLIGATAGHFATLAGDGTKHEILFTDLNGSSCSVERWDLVPVSGLRQEAYLAGRAVYENDFPNSRWAGLLPQGHVHIGNVLFAPMVIRGQALGLLALANKPGGFTDEDACIASAFAELAAIALHNNRAEEALRESEERFRLLVAGVKDRAIYMLDPQGTIISWNEGAERIKGYGPEEIVGQHFSRFFTPEQLAQGEPERELRIAEAEGRFEGEALRVRRDGSRFWASVSISALKDETGRLRGFAKITRDITERKRAEEALRESEERYRTLIEMSPDAIVVAGLDAKITMCNRKAVELYGTEDPHELLGRSAIDLIAPEERGWAMENLMKTLENGSVAGVEYTILRKDGSRFPVELSASTLLDRRGQPYGFIAVVRDITERKRAEENLRESEERYRTLVEFSPDGVVIHSGGNIVFANAGAAKLAGAEAPEQLIGKPILSFVHPDYREIVKERVRRMMEEGAQVPLVEEKLLRLDRSEVDVETMAMPFTYQGQRAVQVVMHDITRRKRAAEQIRRQLNRLEALHQIDMAITGSVDIRITLNVLLDQVCTQLEADAADVLLLDPNTHILEFATGRGFRTAALQHTRLKVGQGLAGRAALERRMVIVPNISHNVGDLGRSPFLAAEQFVSYHAVPLIAKGDVKGVLEIFHRSPLEPDEEWMAFLEALAMQAAIAIDDAGLFNDLQRSNVELTLAYDTTIEGWSRALDLRDKETEGHSHRVTDMTLRLARALGVGKAEQVHIHRGALLHDIGKMAIPDSILLKPGPLDDEEWEIMRRHPVYAYELLSPIAYLRTALDIPYCHHEKWDGSGYPRGLKGEQIPLAARIFAVADVYDALNSDRPYRPAWSREEVQEHILSLSGTHFDPRVVDVFSKMIEQADILIRSRGSGNISQRS